MHRSLLLRELGVSKPDEPIEIAVSRWEERSSYLPHGYLHRRVIPTCGLSYGIPDQCDAYLKEATHLPTFQIALYRIEEGQTTITGVDFGMLIDEAADLCMQRVDPGHEHSLAIFRSIILRSNAPLKLIERIMADTFPQDRYCSLYTMGIDLLLAEDD